MTGEYKRNMTLPILESLPEWAHESTRYFGRLREARGRERYMPDPSALRHFVFCHMCKGWIEGQPHEREHNDLGILSGRKGTSYYCPRCGWELDFNGIIA